MLFNTRLLARQLAASLLRSAGTDARLTARRWKTLVITLVILAGVKIAFLVAALLDDLFFPGWRRQPVDRPVFVIGNFRSGTTFLHRLLARDGRHFTAMETWEIYAAPTVSQRKLMRGLAMADRFIGAPLHRLLRLWEQRTLERIPLHRVAIHEPEEDEGLMLHIWSSLFLWFLFPLPGVPLRYQRFDQEVPLPEKRRIMRFYRRSIQRHLYAHGGHRRYLAKNPSASPRLATLHEAFPDARFIYIARNPLQMLPSKLAWFAFCFHYFNDPLRSFPYRDEVVEMALHWYTYPVQWIEQRPQSGMILRFDDLVEETPAVLRRIYDRLEIPLSDELFARMVAVAAEAHRTAPHHDHSLHKWGLSEDAVRARFAGVLRRFAFETDLV